jgi:hypothetical protein
MNMDDKLADIHKFPFPAVRTFLYFLVVEKPNLKFHFQVTICSNFLLNTDYLDLRSLLDAYRARNIDTKT